MQLQSHGLVHSVVVGSILHLGCSDVENEEALATWPNTYQNISKHIKTYRNKNPASHHVTKSRSKSLIRRINPQAVQSGRNRQKDHRYHGCQVEELSIMHRLSLTHWRTPPFNGCVLRREPRWRWQTVVSLLVVAYRTAHPSPVPKWRHFFQHVSAGEGAMTESPFLDSNQGFKDMILGYSRVCKEYQSNLTHKPMGI